MLLHFFNCNMNAFNNLIANNLEWSEAISQSTTAFHTNMPDVQWNISRVFLVLDEKCITRTKFFRIPLISVMTRFFDTVYQGNLKKYMSFKFEPGGYLLRIKVSSNFWASSTALKPYFYYTYTEMWIIFILFLKKVI